MTLATRRLYPWGNDTACATNGTCCPPLTPTYGTLLNVTSYPRGASPFGVLDLVGNVWQFTDEFSDEHTRGEQQLNIIGIIEQQLSRIRGGSISYNPLSQGT